MTTTDPQIWRWTLTSLYFSVLVLICVYGLHRYWLLLLFRRNRRNVPRARARFTRLPSVTVQLPMYNEPRVAHRAIAAACRLDYPRDRLQIQILDDSDDGSERENRALCHELAASGAPIEYHHRTDRTGFKAGALAAATPSASGEFIALFDADFVPPANFLRRTIHHFTDPDIGMVQARWGHLNRESSPLTRCQAIFLDGHFLIEHAARNRANRWINFNGTAGVWRRTAIEQAGGWQHDTLTEDVDLSYRAQLAGWRFVFLPHVTCPAELPPEINAFKAQQHRWTKGSIQTALKLLPRILRQAPSFAIKAEAFFHLTSPIVYLLVTLLALLLCPLIVLNAGAFAGGDWWIGAMIGVTLFIMGTLSAATFYTASQRVQRRSVWRTLVQLPLLMGVGIGIAVNNARGCIEALVGHDSPFVRTPKYSQTTDAVMATDNGRRRARLAVPSIKLWMSALEIAMGLYMLGCVEVAVSITHAMVGLPFILLFAGGYLYVGTSSLAGQLLTARASRPAPTRTRHLPAPT